MGMFDYVRYSAPCAGCGHEINSNWQTKDWNCALDVLDIDPQKIRNWYTTCDRCGTWNEKNVKVTAWEIEDASERIKGEPASGEPTHPHPIPPVPTQGEG